MNWNYHLHYTKKILVFNENLQSITNKKNFNIILNYLNFLRLSLKKSLQSKVIMKFPIACIFQGIPHNYWTCLQKRINKIFNYERKKRKNLQKFNFNFYSILTMNIHYVLNYCYSLLKYFENYYYQQYFYNTNFIIPFLYIIIQE